MRTQSNREKQGRGNDIIRLVPQFDIEYITTAEFHRANANLNLWTYLSNFSHVFHAIVPARAEFADRKAADLKSI